MPDARGNFKGISLGGRAAEAWDRIFGPTIVRGFTATSDGHLIAGEGPWPNLTPPSDDDCGCGTDCGCCCT